MIRITKSGCYFVFKSNIEAEKWEWLFWKVLRRQVCCFGQFDNAYVLFEWRQC